MTEVTCEMIEKIIGFIESDIECANNYDADVDSWNDWEYYEACGRVIVPVELEVEDVDEDAWADTLNAIVSAMNGFGYISAEIAEDDMDAHTYSISVRAEEAWKINAPYLQEEY